MTALPVKPPIPPEQALLFVDEMRERLTFVTLDSAEYISVTRTIATRGLSSGQVYDALHLSCAAKVKARSIYTWDMKHFHAIAPELAARIRTP